MVRARQPADQPVFALRHEDVQLADDVHLDDIFEARSMPLHMPGQQQGTSLPLFGGGAVQQEARQQHPADAEEEPPPLEEPGAAPPAGSGPGAATHVLDGVVFTGGLVWDADWCPQPSTSDASGTEVLALSVHPGGHLRSPVGQAMSGQGAIQLWSVPRSSAAPGAAPDGLPRPLACLLHGGLVCWSLRWCPDPRGLVAGLASGDGTAAAAEPAAAGGASVPVLGLLAAVLGQGQVCIWAVPAAEHLASLGAGSSGRGRRGGPPRQPEGAGGGASGGGQADGAAGEGLAVGVTLAASCPALRLAPVAVVESAAMSGSLPRCCEWQLGGAAGARLLVGCWDGTVWLGQLPTQPGGALQPLLHTRASHGPVHAVQWMPPPPEPEEEEEEEGGDEEGEPTCSSTLHTDYFLTAGATGEFQVWHLSDPHVPKYKRMPLRVPINAAVWTRQRPGIYAAYEDGILRRVWLDASDINTLGPDALGSAGFPGAAPTCLHAVAACEAGQVVAYAGDDALIGLGPIYDQVNTRKRGGHAALGAIAVEDGQAYVLRGQDVPGNGGLYTGGRVNGSDELQAASTVVAGSLGVLLDERQAVHALAFGRWAGGSAWLAAGNGAGCLRLLRLGPRAVPILGGTYGRPRGRPPKKKRGGAR